MDSDRKAGRAPSLQTGFFDAQVQAPLKAKSKTGLKKKLVTAGFIVDYMKSQCSPWYMLHHMLILLVSISAFHQLNIKVKKVSINV